MNRRGYFISSLGLLLVLMSAACGQQPDRGHLDAIAPTATINAQGAVPSAVETISVPGTVMIPQPVISVEPPLNAATADVQSTAIVQRTATAQAYAEALQTSISAAATALVVQAPTLTAVAINRYNALHPEPKSSPAEMNKPYDFSLFTHCGVDFSTDFDGSFWDAADKTNRPRSLDYDFQRGTMTLVDESHARFDFEGGSVLFVRHTGPKVLPGVCQ
jgi:hypothetical protein